MQNNTILAYIKQRIENSINEANFKLPPQLWYFAFGIYDKSLKDRIARPVGYIYIFNNGQVIFEEWYPQLSVNSNCHIYLNVGADNIMEDIDNQINKIIKNKLK